MAVLHANLVMSQKTIHHHLTNMKLCNWGQDFQLNLQQIHSSMSATQSIIILKRDLPSNAPVLGFSWRHHNDNWGHCDSNDFSLPPVLLNPGPVAGQDDQSVGARSHQSASNNSLSHQSTFILVMIFEDENLWRREDWSSGKLTKAKPFFPLCLHNPILRRLCYIVTSYRDQKDSWCMIWIRHEV